MKTLLFINVCMRGEDNSRTYGLCKAFLDAFAAAHPDYKIVERDLTKGDLPLLTAAKAQEREEQARLGDLTSPLLEIPLELAGADRVVIGAPYWDLSFPAGLKVYLEWASTLGVTFRYTDAGESQGLCKADKLLYITTAGGPVQGQNFGYDYVKALSAMLGIRHAACVHAEMMDVWGGPGVENLADARAQLEGLAQNW